MIVQVVYCNKTLYTHKVQANGCEDTALILVPTALSATTCPFELSALGPYMWAENKSNKPDKF